MKTLWLKIVFCSLIVVCSATYAATQYDKVIIFGDSLSDIGNNHYNTEGQAPETNRVLDKTTGKYIPGNVWVIPFVKQLAQDGLIPQTATKVVSSRCFDPKEQSNDCPQTISSSDSLDFAYSGDPSGGYINPKTGNVAIQAHAYDNKAGQWLPNFGCELSGSSNYPTFKFNSNGLCGTYNRIVDFTNPNPLTPAPFTLADPNTLYVIWVGANDIEQNLSGQLLKDVIGDSKKSTAENYAALIRDLNDSSNSNSLKSKGTQTVLQIMDNIDYSIIHLNRVGVKNFVILNIPNLSLTPQGYFLNQVYQLKYKSLSNYDPNLMTKLFNTLTNNINSQLSMTLNNIASYHHITIIQPNMGQLFDMVRNGYNGRYIPAFPASAAAINQKSVMQWFSWCCPLQNDYNYDPTKCVTSSSNKICSGPMPILPKSMGSGHFIFFNDIHPTTCAHKYIASYVAAAVEGKMSTYDPTIIPNLCDGNS